jgi:hypothetical protein
MHLLHSHVTSSHLAQISSSALNPQTLSCSSPNIRNQVSCPYKTIGNIRILYILMLIFFYSEPKTKKSGPNGSRDSRVQYDLNFSRNVIFICALVLKYLKCAIISKGLLPIFMSDTVLHYIHGKKIYTSTSQHFLSDQ